MPVPLRSLLPVLRPRLQGLVDAAAWRGLEGLAARLPALGSWGCCELRLGAGLRRVDFSLSASADEGGREELTAALGSGGDFPGWEGVRPLLAEWARPGGLFEEVPTIWLEYDLPEGRPQPPFLFLTFMGPVGPGRPLSPAELRSLAEAYLCRLPGWGGDRGGGNPVRLLELCARALPPGGRVLHLAALPSWRGAPALRLDVLVPKDALAGWLAAIGWAGDPRQREVARERFLGDHGKRVQIGLDLGTEVRPNLALETSIRATPQRTGWWDELIHRLVAGGVCTAEKGRAVLAWMGTETVLLPDADWRLRIDRQAAIKVDVDPDGRARAKAYLAFHPSYSLL